MCGVCVWCVVYVVLVSIMVWVCGVRGAGGSTMCVALVRVWYVVIVWCMWCKCRCDVNGVPECTVYFMYGEYTVRVLHGVCGLFVVILCPNKI